MARKAKKIKGTRILPSGNLQTVVRVNGQLIPPKTFPAGTDPRIIADWIANQKKLYRGTMAVAGSFADLAHQHVESYTGLRSYKPRRSHLSAWISVLGGDRSPASITAVEITAAIRQWQTEGYSQNTVRDRKKSLVTFFNVMLKGGPNPAREAVRVKEPKLEARGRDMRIIQAAIDAMPEYAKATIPRLSLAKVRARVIAWTGIPPGMLGQLRPHDFDLVHGTVRTPPREKGDGVEARTLNLTPEGLEAVRVFHQANAYGRFPSKTVNDAVKSAARKVGVDPKTIRLYDLRHSFLSQMYRATKDQATVGRFALHAPGSRLTARYTEAANEAVDRAAVVAFTESLAPTSGTVAVPKVARKVARRRKSKQTLKLAQG